MLALCPIAVAVPRPRDYFDGPLRPVELERQVKPVLQVPDSAFVDANGKPREPSMLVRHQTATCPDAQCPRGKMENIDYFAKGYNVYFGNPMSTKAGVDPGFTEHAGGLIWKLEYTNSQQTADGLWDVPDHTIVEHNVGCSLAMTTEEASSMKDVSEEYSNKAAVSVEAEGLMFSGKFSAESEWRGLAQQNSQEKTVSITSSADCVVYHARVQKFAPKPKFTENFLRGVQYLVAGAQEYDLQEELSRLGWVPIEGKQGSLLGDPYISPPPPAGTGVAGQGLERSVDAGLDGSTTTAEWAKHAAQMRHRAAAAKAANVAPVRRGDGNAEVEMAEGSSFLEASSAVQRIAQRRRRKLLGPDSAELEHQLRNLEQMAVAENVVSALYGNSSDLESNIWRCEVILYYDKHPKKESYYYTSSMTRQKNGNKHFENDIIAIELKSHGGGKACQSIRIYDEDEGCGDKEDSQVYTADGEGKVTKTSLPGDVKNDAACFAVYVNPSPPPPPAQKQAPPEESVKQSNGDVVTINSPRVDGRVGTCMCPDGSIYEVGDLNKNTGACKPACYGGIASEGDKCETSDGPSSHNEVTCSEEHGELAEHALEYHAKYRKAKKEAEKLKEDKGEDSDDYKEKMKEAMTWLNKAHAKLHKLRGSEPTQIFPANSWKINSFEPAYTLFSEFGTHWQEYSQMGARYGLKTIIKSTKVRSSSCTKPPHIRGSPSPPPALPSPVRPIRMRGLCTSPGIHLHLALGIHLHLALTDGAVVLRPTAAREARGVGLLDLGLRQLRVQKDGRGMPWRSMRQEGRACSEAHKRAATFEGQ